MPKIKYKDVRMNDARMLIVRQANAIIADYVKQGFQLTLRQLYYQFVSRDLMANTDKNYKKLGEIISNARLAGLIDWTALVDHTRYVRSLAHWSNPADIVAACPHSFRVDMWKDQKHRPEIWIEKDALVSVFERVANDYDVPLFSCRGYTSQSAMWRAAGRLGDHMANGQTPIIFHFGDHDPSGLDMSRDIRERLEMFMGDGPLERLALNMDQVEEYEPPPNPAKLTDSRCKWYIKEYDTTNSWELDALSPKVLYDIAKDQIEGLIDWDVWKKNQAYQDKSRKQLDKVSRHFDKVAKLVSKLK